MGRYTPGSLGGDVAGFSAIELLVVLAALAIVSTIYMALQRPSEIYPVENAAQRLAGEIERARDQAVVSEGEALVAVRPDGSFAARHGTARTLSLAGISADEWEQLPEGLGWGAGDATHDPFGGAVAPLPAQVYCDADGLCATPAPAAVYTIRSNRDAHRVSAITLDTSGTVQVWRWEAGAGRWMPVAR